MLQFGASLTDDDRSINYDRNTFIIQATVDICDCNNIGAVCNNSFLLSLNMITLTKGLSYF